MQDEHLVTEGRRVCLLILKENLGVLSPGCEYRDDFHMDMGTILVLGYNSKKNTQKTKEKGKK